MIESCNGTIDGSILPFSLPPFPSTLRGEYDFSKKFLFRILRRGRNDFSSGRTSGKRRGTKEEKKRERERASAPIETARSFPCFQLSIGEKEEEEDECSSERG